MRIFVLILVLGIIMISCKSSSEPQQEEPPVTGDLSPIENQQGNYVFKLG